MNNVFKRSSSHWVKYSEYECRRASDGNLYVTPAPNAMPSVYDPLEDAEAMVLEALNVGMLCMNKASEEAVKAAAMQFVSHYGLLGLITALPTTPDFMDYEAVYLPTNHFIREESLKTDKYLSLFLPFEKPALSKKGKKTRWEITNRTMIALSMAFKGKPMAMQLSFQREYAERYDWLVTQFRDWAFALCSSYFYYKDYAGIDEDAKNIYRLGMAAFSGMSPSFHIELRERPTIIWDFHSLLLGIHIMFSFMLTDESSGLKLCQHCHKAFIGSRANAAFCSPRCKNQYNVYKSRGKSGQPEAPD